MQSSLQDPLSRGNGLSPIAIRDQLERILAAGTFSRSERLARFLRFVVEETLAGRGDSLKEQTLALTLYARQRQSNGDDDPVVRADARRVRDKLREYYAEVPGEPVIISLPKGSYTPTFEGSGEPAKAAPDCDSVELEIRPSSRIWRRPPVWLWIAAATATLAAGALLLWTNRPLPAPPRIISLTQYPGGESDPSFSPDGNFVAFARWHPPEPQAQDIWIKEVQGEALRQLTDTAPPVAEHSPAWSPDGKEIAFQRVGWAGTSIPNPGIFVVSVLGGAERRISDSGTNPAWSVDGRSLLIVDGEPSAIVQIDLATLRRRTIIEAPPGETIGKFALSSGGATLAFLRSRRAGVSDVYVVPAGGGEPRRLTAWGASMEGLAWTPDCRDILYDVAGQSLWRIPASTASPGKGTPVPGLESLVTPAARALKPVILPAAQGRGARLAFQVQKADVSLRMIDLESPFPGNVLRARPFLDSTRVDMPGPFSPDGSRISFYSYWAGFPAPLWVANRDGSNLRQIGSMRTPLLKIGSWSPDGRRIAFDAAVEGNSEIYVTGENGGAPQRITNDAATDVSPSWSSDGRWIYYSSNKTGRSEVWRIGAAGGGPAQITHTGGAEPAESMDGKFLYYLEPGNENGIIRSSRLKMAPAGGGEENVVLDSVRRGLWGVTARGILFLTAEKDFEAIDLYEFPDGKVTRIGRLAFQIPRQFPGMTFSRDGRWALTNQVDRRESDLMMMEDFR